MFIISVIEDEIPLPACSFIKGKHTEELCKLIEEKYIDRVLPEIGLVVSFYDILTIRETYIFPGDFKESQGEAACTVTFRLVVFKPSIDELLVGRIISSSTTGLQVSIGDVFQHIEIPVKWLRQPCVFDEKSRSWAWSYNHQFFFYNAGEEIALLVKSFQIGIDDLLPILGNRRQILPAGHRKIADVDHAPNSAEPAKTSPFSMLIIGSVDANGLGPLNWWI